MTEPAVLTVPEAAAILRVSEWLVAAMARDGRLPRVPGMRNVRIPRAAVVAMLEGYDVRDGEPGGQAPRQASASRRGHRSQANGSLASEAVVGGGPLHRRIGPATGDVVVRIVERRS